MTHKPGRMATYPKLGESQLSLQEERPHGETPHSMRVYVPSPNRPYPWSSGARPPLQTHIDPSGSRKCHGTRPHTQKLQCR